MSIEEEIAEFENKLAVCKTGEERCDLYLQKVQLLWTKDLAVAQKFVLDFLAEAEKSGLVKYLCFSNQILGAILVLSGKYAEALNACNQSLIYAKEMGNELAVANLYNHIGAIYGFTFLFEEALEYFQDAINLFLKVGNTELAQITRGNIAGIYAKLGMFDKGLEMMLSLIAEGYTDPGLYNNLAIEYLRSEQLKEAEKYLQAGIQLINEKSANNVRIDLFHTCAILSIKKQNFSEAKDYLLKAKKLAEEYKRQDSLIENFKCYAELYVAMSEWEKAEENYLSALSLFHKDDIKQNIAEILCSLKDLYLVQKDYKQAINYANRYIKTVDAIKADEVKVIKKMLEVKQKYFLVQKEKGITDSKNKELEEKNIIIEKEKQESERLLLNILPSEVAEELKSKGFADAKHFNDVTVLFTDFVGFTTVSEQLTPQQLVDELHACFSAFDGIIQKYNIEKIKTVGDAYLAVCGLPLVDETHAENIIRAAIEIKEFILSRKKNLDDKTFEIRIGIHSGSVVAGIVGVKKFAYDIWGDTVNTAARMEQNSEAGKINISEATYDLVKDKFACKYRGEIEAKNKGKMKMYFVV